MSETVFVRAYPPAQPKAGPSVLLLFREQDLLVFAQGDEVRLLRTEDVPSEWIPQDPLYLGERDGVPCLANEAPASEELPDGVIAVNLRALYDRVPDADFGLAGYASQMLYWRRTSRFCPVCGHETEPGHRDWGRHCPNCGHTGYPRVSPAVLILIYDAADRLLLATKPGWGDRYSILAGFVEPGETLEDCVRRETLEEVSLAVTDLEYDGSQTWPFPHQLMVGFKCRYAGGEIRLDDEELAAASWFERGALPQLPPKVSLSRQMIDRWIDRRPALGRGAL